MDGPGVTRAGESREIVVRGSVLQLDGTAAHPAVVTVVKIDGTPVDWSRGDSDGNYSVVLPGPGNYLVLANALGWVPRAEVMEFRDATGGRHLTLTDRLTLSGRITRGGQPVPDALVTLGEAAGGTVQSVHTDKAGTYCMPLPAAGRYIVTALEPDTWRATARKIVLDVRSAVVDIETPVSELSSPARPA